MVVCQYFLRGTCRFGSNCRNEHPTGWYAVCAFKLQYKTKAAVVSMKAGLGVDVHFTLKIDLVIF